MPTWRAFCWHGLAFAWFVYVAGKAVRLVPAFEVQEGPAIVRYGGPWKFLTVLNLLLQAILFAVALLVDVFALMKKQQIAKFVLPFRDLLFGSLALPVSMFVFTFFWMLVLYDRKLIVPKGVDMILPSWLNHAMHTSICPSVLTELCITPHRYPSKGKRLTLLGIAALGYICWMLRVYFVTGRWVYPLFDTLNPLAIAAVFLVSTGALVFYSNVGAFLCRMIWGDTVVILGTARKKSK